eukprot:934731-Rhodomonas_salina.2
MGCDADEGGARRRRERSWMRETRRSCISSTARSCCPSRSRAPTAPTRPWRRSRSSNRSQPACRVSCSGGGLQSVVLGVGIGGVGVAVAVDVDLGAVGLLGLGLGLGVRVQSSCLCRTSVHLPPQPPSQTLPEQPSRRHDDALSTLTRPCVGQVYTDERRHGGIDAELLYPDDPYAELKVGCDEQANGEANHPAYPRYLTAFSTWSLHCLFNVVSSLVPLMLC